MTRIVGKQNRSPIVLHCQEAWDAGRHLDRLLQFAQVPHARGVFRGSHQFLSALDERRSVEAARRLNASTAKRSNASVECSDGVNMDAPRQALTQALRRLPLRSVRSTAIRRIGYDPELRMVGVMFIGSGDTVYGYPNLSDEEIRGLLDVFENEESLGHYVSTVIKLNHDAERVQI